ncbi:MAG TPA: ABC transporter substrate-binding protein [Ectothiorhodospiraceae bacterium]|nr:ABC transporter substrate-binding protein [Ectothiorhodospiraceae bacterium]
MKMFLRLRQSLFAVVVIMLCSAGMAQAVSEPAASKSENVGPVVMLQTATHRLLVQMEQEREQIKKDGSKLFDLASKVLLQHFDINAMSRWVLGKHWKGASSEQRQQFTQEFQTLVIRFYVAALFDDPKLLDEILELGDRIITYQPVTWDEKTKKVTVKSIFSVPSGLEIPVNFKVYHSKKGAWLIYDVNVDGISLITNYRNSFGAEIRKDGLAAMLDRLINKNREKSDKLTALR